MTTHETPAPMTQAAIPSGQRRGIRRFDARIALMLILLVGTLAFLPALRSPFMLDDYMHTSMVEGTFPGQRGPFDLYDFVNDTDRGVFMTRGLLPWWTHPKLTIRFFRPL